MKQFMTLMTYVTSLLNESNQSKQYNSVLSIANLCLQLYKIDELLGQAKVFQFLDVPM